MPRYWKSKAILAKTETTYGTDAVPTGAANALVTTNFQINPLKTITVEREIDVPYMGARPSIPVAANMEMSFGVELAPSGTAGTAPAWGVLLRACGFAETTVASTSVAYNPISAGHESLTLYANIDGKNHKMLGARGTVSFKFNAKQVPMLEFTFQGLWVLATDTVLPAVTTSAWKTPLPVNNVNTGAFSLHGYSANLYAFEQAINNQIVYRNIVGAEDILQTDRKGSGSITIEDPLMVAKDYFTAIKNAVAGAFTVTHGTVAGAKVKIDANLELNEPSYGQEDGIPTLKMSAKAVPSAGNDELIITCL